MDCHSLIQLGYDAFSKELHEKVFQKRTPVNGSLEVTMRCNLRCVHCYIPFSQRGGSRQKELSFAEIQRIFAEIAEAGCLWLLLTGGEPLLRQDFLQIYDAAKRTGFIITLFTNATLVTERIADYLAEWRPFVIEVSLYGATQDTYERVTGVPGSFARCMNGIELMLERGLPVRLKSVLLTLNQHELAQMKQLSEGLGLEFGYDPVINAGIDGSLYPTQFRLTPEQILSIETSDQDRIAEWPRQFEELKKIKIDHELMYICGAGRSTFHIDSFGRLCICLIVREPNYNLRQGSFREGWEQFIQSMLTQKYSQSYPCLACEIRTVCPQCPAMGITEFGDPEARVPFICQLAHLRKEAFDHY